MKIFDCVTYLNEDHLLDLRFNILNEYIDFFVICEAKEDGLRVDIFINKREKLLSRTKIKNLILNGKLKLNNKIINSPSKKVLSGDKVNLEIQWKHSNSINSIK